jgi:ABC-2 type transport system ATP-binding protein
MSRSSGALLIVENLRKGYRRRPVLRDVSFEAHPGEAFAIIGPNGAGKSTLLGCLTGERVPDGGSIRICGNDAFEDPRATAKCMGSVPEQPYLYDELTVEEILTFVAEARRLEPAVTSSETRRLLELFALAGAENVPCGELSQGMAKKVAILIALLHEPRFIVLDEVFNGLDQRSSGRLLDELDRRRTQGAVILLSSHDHHLLARWCDRGLLLESDGWKMLAGDDWADWRRSQG